MTVPPGFLWIRDSRGSNGSLVKASAIVRISDMGANGRAVCVETAGVINTNETMETLSRRIAEALK